MDLQSWAWGWIVWLRNKLFTDEKRISNLERRMELAMAAIDDVKAAEENLKAAVLSKVTDLQNQLTAALAKNMQPDLTAPLEALASDMNAFADSLKPAAPPA